MSDPASVMIGGRHPAVRDLMRFLRPNPKLPPVLYSIAALIWDAALEVLADVPEDSAELTAGLRKLLEAKDCVVRAALTEQDLAR
jgi:hypothetical protein